MQFEFLDPTTNFHWTGLQHEKHLKPVWVGDYEEWFRWFMRWQRFNAFQIVVLVTPARRLIGDERRGYLDGLLTRLLNGKSVHKVILVEEERFQPMLRRWLGGDDHPGSQTELQRKFGQRQFEAAVASLLYGTHLSSRELPLAAASTLSSKLGLDWEHELREMRRRPALVHRISRWMFTAGYHAREMVESMETQEARKSLENPEQPLPSLFKQASDKGPSELSQDWLEGLARSLLDLQGWFTLQGLYDYIQVETQKVLQTSESFPHIFNDNYDFDLPGDRHVFVPSRHILRSIVDRLAEEGKVQKATWTRETGRPRSSITSPAGSLSTHRSSVGGVRSICHLGAGAESGGSSTGLTGWGTRGGRGTGRARSPPSSCTG